MHPYPHFIYAKDHLLIEAYVFFLSAVGIFPPIFTLSCLFYFGATHEKLTHILSVDAVCFLSIALFQE